MTDLADLARASERVEVVEDHARLAHGVVAERVSRQSHKPVVILPREP